MMSSSLTSEIESALSDLERQPLGHLPLIKRKRLWLAMFPDISTPQGITAGLVRTAQLDILSIRHVMGAWKLVFPADDGPERMLSIAQQLLTSQTDRQAAQRARDAFYVEVVENRKYRPDQYSAMFVGHAAASAVTSALIQTPPSVDDDDEDDEDLDPESYDPSYLCASAAAGGLNSLSSANIPLRRAFWHWYLKQGIPAACNYSSGIQR